MSLLSLYIPDRWDSASSAPAWRWRHDSGLRGDTGDGQPLPPAREVRLVLPTTRVLHAAIDLPRRGRWRETLPFALEDRVLADPESLHVAAGDRRSDGSTALAAVERQWLGAVLARAGQLGLQPQAAYAEAELMTARADEWLLLIDLDGKLLVTPNGGVLVLDESGEDVPPRLLTVELERAGERRPARLRVRVRPGARLPAGLAYWSEVLGLPLVQGQAWDGDLPPIPPANSINLLQGRFAPPRRRALPEGFALTRPAALLLAASLVVYLAVIAVQTVLWAREARALEARSEAALRRAFPETRAILDIPIQMRQGLAALRARAGAGGPGELPALLARAAGVADGLPARLKRLAFSNGELMLDWECADAACATTLRTRLAEPARRTQSEDAAGDALRVRARWREDRP